MSIKLISKTVETTTKIANALEELKKNNPEKYEATILAMDEHNKNLDKQSNQNYLLPAIVIPPLVGELLISAGVITGTVVATQEARNNSVDGIIGNEIGTDYKSIDYTSKDKQKVRTSNPGDYVQTPTSTPESFRKKGENWTNTKTGEVWQKDGTKHYGEGWKVGLGKSKNPTNSDKITVDKDGKVIKKQKGGKKFQ